MKHNTLAIQNWLYECFPQKQEGLRSFVCRKFQNEVAVEDFCTTELVRICATFILFPTGCPILRGTKRQSPRAAHALQSDQLSPTFLCVQFHPKFINVLKTTVIELSIYLRPLLLSKHWRETQMIPSPRLDRVKDKIECINLSYIRKCCGSLCPPSLSPNVSPCHKSYILNKCQHLSIWVSCHTWELHNRVSQLSPSSRIHFLNRRN